MMAAAPPHDEDRDEDCTAIGELARSRVGVRGRHDRAHLIVLAGESLGEMFRVDQPETVIGRASDADIRVQDDGVSRRHARVVQVGHDLRIEDMNSANGTFINDQLIREHVLRDGDRIQIGSTTILKFTFADELEENFQRRMYDAALRDGLTKACNKRHFLERLSTEVAYAMRHRTPLSLLLFDVDNFKQINDRFGHVAGDYVLVTLAQIVGGTLRAEDLFARYGGEEFSVLCRGETLENARMLGERLRAEVERFVFEHHERRIPVTISVGVASWVDQLDAEAHLVADADAALYQAKRAGRNRVVTNSPTGGR